MSGAVCTECGRLFERTPQHFAVCAACNDATERRATSRSAVGDIARQNAAYTRQLVSAQMTADRAVGKPARQRAEVRLTELTGSQAAARRHAALVREIQDGIRQEFDVTAELARSAAGEATALVARIVNGGRRRQSRDDPPDVVIKRAFDERDPVGNDAVAWDQSLRITRAMNEARRDAERARASFDRVLAIAQEVDAAGGQRRCWDCSRWSRKLKGRGLCPACYQRHWREGRFRAG
jgi:hypothetical protein